MLGHDAKHREGVEQRVVGLVEMELHRGVARGHSLVDHRKVRFGSVARDDRVDREGNVIRCKELAIGEVRIGADGKRPSQTILGAAILGRKVVDELKILVRGNKRGLDEWLVHMLAAAPRNKRVKAGRGLAARVHGNNHLVFRSRIATLRRGAARIASSARAASEYAACAQGNRASPCRRKERTPVDHADSASTRTTPLLSFPAHGFSSHT